MRETPQTDELARDWTFWDEHLNPDLKKPGAAYFLRASGAKMIEREKNALAAELERQKEAHKKQMIEVLWSLALSDHLGDVAEAIAPILKSFGMEAMSLDALLAEMKKRDLIPDYARED